MKIKVKESCIVKPAKETPKHVLKSSIVDQVFPNFHSPTVYFYRPDGSENFFDFRLLKEALSKCLVTFYPVAGRLKKREGSACFDIDCNGEGVLFVEAESEDTIDDFGDFAPCSDLLQLIPNVDTSDGSSSPPLLVAQVTYFKCGGACLGIGFQHIQGDGASAIYLINAWSDLTRGISVTIPPFFNRSLLCSRDPPSPTHHHSEYEPPPSMNKPLQTVESQTSTPTLTSTAVIKITRDQLNTLKANSRDDNNSESYSTYETLTAHVWRSSCIARGLGDDQATKLYIPTDGRSRFHPPLPPGYYGNVIFTTTSLALSGDLRSKPLFWAIRKIHDAISRMDDDYLRSALDMLTILQPNPPALLRGARYLMCPNLNVVSWARLPIHDADFGWGRPVHMGPADISFEGNIFILSSPTGDGSLSLLICLEDDHLKAFKTAFYDF